MENGTCESISENSFSMFLAEKTKFFGARVDDVIVFLTDFCSVASFTIFAQLLKLRFMFISRNINK